MRRIRTRYLAVNISVLFLAVFILLRMTHGIYNSVCLFLIGLWSIVAAIANGKVMFQALKQPYCFVLCLFLLFFFLSGMINGNVTYIAKRCLFYTLFFIPYIIDDYEDMTNNSKERLYLVRVILWIWVLIDITAIVFYAKTPDAARILAQGIYRMGVTFIGGGYALGFASAILLVFLLGIRKNNARVLFSSTIQWYVTVLLLFCVVIMTRSTITILAMTVGIISIPFTNIKNHRMFSSNAIGMSILLGVFIFRQIIGWLIVTVCNRADYTDEIKLRAFGRFLINNKDYYAATRMHLANLSIKTALSNPVLGVGYKYGYYQPTSYYYGVGGHSEFLDGIAQYGVVGSLLFFCLFILGVKEIYSIYKLNEKVFNGGWVICVLIMGLFNTIEYLSVGLTIFLVLPLISRTVLYQETDGGRCGI